MVERTLPKPDTRVRFPSAALQSLLLHGRRLFILSYVGRVEAVCSLLLQGTRPRSASDTLMSRRNIPASPLLPSPLPVVRGRGAAVRQGCEPRATLLGKSVRGEGGRNTGVGYRRQLAQNEDWVQGAYLRARGKKVSAQPCERARPSYTFLKRHQGARALRGRVSL